MPLGGNMFEHEYADVNNVRLHYVTAGKGKLMMFLHGFPEFWYGWKNQVVEFGRDYQAVAPDMRGYNLSSKPTDAEQYRIKYLIEDVRALAEYLGHKKFILVAHDWGGGVAWPFAMRHPEYLEKLIIINAPHPVTFVRELRENPAQRKASQYILVHRTPEAEDIMAKDNYALLVKNLLKGHRTGVFHGGRQEGIYRGVVAAWGAHRWSELLSSCPSRLFYR
jgi:pimeloyl-ACP methyl ester carboxylesterase